MQVGEIVNRLRKEREMTLAELSAKSGVALATLSRMENGKMIGTLESHMNICKALDLNLPDLYKDLAASKKTVEVRQQKAAADIFIHDKRSSSEMLASNALNKKMLPIMIKLGKGGATRKEQAKTGVERFIYIVEGKVEATIGEEKYNLARGDTLYFESSLPHHFKNTGRDETRIISVTCPPTL